MNCSSYSVSFGIADIPTFSGGSGTAANPYLISNATQFRLINSVKDGMSKHYALIADIDFNRVSYAPIGTEDKPFLGTLDGNGYEIKNINVYGGEHLGLFNVIGSGGVVRDLKINKC